MGEKMREAWAAVMAAGQTPRADGTAPDSIRSLFAADPQRFEGMSFRADNMLLDISKTAIDGRAMAALLELAKAAGVEERRDAMANGEHVNVTENRRALHMALRAPVGASRASGGAAVAAEVHSTLGRMHAFTQAVHGGALRGATGNRFTHVLNIGIGGSDLGPVMAVRALINPASPMQALHLGNVDGHGWRALLATLDPTRTLVLVASKTFTTQETMANAVLVKGWLAETLGEDKAASHMAALSTNIQACADFGIPSERVFPFGDYVGGRFSMWSAIGLSLALALGWDSFERMLEGARAMDLHFLRTPLAENLPVLLALTEVWHVNALGLNHRAVLPYDERLRRLPAHLQQLEMESLGKRVTLRGAPVPQATGPVVFGEPGSSAQHSFMQMVHQSPQPVPVDFILIARPDHPWTQNHRILLAHGLAQAEGLLAGKNADAVRAEMRAAGSDEAAIERLVEHRVFPGDRPSTTLLLPRLESFTFGQLIALYEHKVAVLGALWDINPFDQWGVELGKQLANPLLAQLEERVVKPGQHDGSTMGLLREILKLRADG
jgi:glucose-6-phosphate isomerase